MKITALPLTAIALCTATGAFAQSTEYLSYGLSYTNLSSGSQDVDLLSGSTGIDYRNGNFIANGDFTMFNLDDGSASETVTGINATIGYFVRPNIAVYGGLNYADNDAGNSSSYLLGAEYMTGPMTFGLNYADSDDWADSIWSLYGSYQVSDALEAGLYLTDLENNTVTSIALDFDNGVFDVIALIEEDDGFTSFLTTGHYDFGNNFRVLASYGSFENDGDLYRIGAGYEVVDDMWIDASFGQIDVDGTTIDSIGLAFTFETGRETLLVDRASSLQGRAFGALAANTP